MVEDPNAPAVMCDTDSIEMLEGDVIAPPPEGIEQQEPVEIDGVMQQEDPEDNRDRRTR